MKRLLLLALATLLLVGCAGRAPGEVPRNPDAPPVVGAGSGGESAALALVNLWRVSDAAGESPDTWLRIDAGEWQLWRDCGMVTGSWRATQTLFLASVYGASGACVTEGVMPEAPWLATATSYHKVEGGWELLGAAGEVVASLAADGAPRPDPNAAGFYTEPPTITDATREALRKAAPLPDSLVAATDGALTGKWVPVAYAVATNPHVQFMDDGTWKGSDGCNGGGGRWLIGDAGEFLATSGPTTLIACEGAPVPVWVSQAAMATFDQDWLLLLDQDGNEIGRLERA